MCTCAAAAQEHRGQRQRPQPRYVLTQSSQQACGGFGGAWPPGTPPACAVSWAHLGPAKLHYTSTAVYTAVDPAHFVGEQGPIVPSATAVELHPCLLLSMLRDHSVTTQSLALVASLPSFPPEWPFAGIGSPSRTTEHGGIALRIAHNGPADNVTAVSMYSSTVLLTNI